MTSNDGRRPHRRHDGLFRRGYPILAVGVVLVVVGVSWLLVGGPGSGTPVLAAGQAPAAGPASAGTIYGCASPGGGFSSLSFTVAPTCPRGTYRVSWQVQLTQPAPAGSPATAPASTATGLPTAAPTGHPHVRPYRHPHQFFGLAPADAQLPRSDAYCDSQVQLMAETVPANPAANHDAQPAGADSHWVRG